MIDYRNVSAASSPPGRSTRGRGALSLALEVLGALGLFALAGCSAAPVDATAGDDAEESLGQASEALGVIIDGVQVVSGRVTFALNNVYSYANPYYNIRWGIVGGSLTTTTIYGATFAMDGLVAGASYTFAAQACDGYAWGWGNTCSAWATPVTVFMPYAGSTWAYSAAYPTGGLPAAWGAGYYVNNGANVALPLCSALGTGGQYLGYWYDGGCSLGYGGAPYTYPNAQVLLNVPASATWSAYTNGFVPHGALRGGYYGGSSLYACRASYLGAYVPGWTTGGACNITWNGAYYAAPASASQILCF